MYRYFYILTLCVAVSIVQIQGPKWLKIFSRKTKPQTQEVKLTGTTINVNDKEWVISKEELPPECKGKRVNTNPTSHVPNVPQTEEKIIEKNIIVDEVIREIFIKEEVTEEKCIEISGKEETSWIISAEEMPPECKGKQCLMSDLTEIPNVRRNSLYYRIEVGNPRPEALKKAKKELRETPELARESIAALQKLIRKEKTLYVPVDNVAWLTRFLRPTKFYPESAFNLIKAYYSFKIKHNKIYDGLTPSKEKNIFDQDIVVVPPVRDQEGRRILLVELGQKWQYKECSLDEVFKSMVLLSEIAMLEPETQISGIVVIIDMNGLTIWQAKEFSYSFAKRILEWIQGSMPLRVKGIHLVKQPKIFDMVFSVFSRYMNHKIRSRVYFHATNMNSLHQYIAPEVLPVEYGGTSTVPRLTGPDWYKILIKLEKEYEVVNSFGYNKKPKM